MPSAPSQSKLQRISCLAQLGSASAGTIVKYWLQGERTDVERGEGMIAVEAVEAAVAKIVIMSNDGSMSLTPRNTTPHSPRQIHRRWELKDERAYSGGKIRLDVAAEVAGEVVGEVVTTTGETITIEARTAMTI